MIHVPFYCLHTLASLPVTFYKKVQLCCIYLSALSHKVKDSTKGRTLRFGNAGFLRRLICNGRLLRWSNKHAVAVTLARPSGGRRYLIRPLRRSAITDLSHLNCRLGLLKRQLAVRTVLFEGWYRRSVSTSIEICSHSPSRANTWGLWITAPEFICRITLELRSESRKCTLSAVRTPSQAQTRTRKITAATQAMNASCTAQQQTHHADRSCPRCTETIDVLGWLYLLFKRLL